MGGKDGTTDTGCSLYTMTESTETVDASTTTTITITGVAEGTTSVTVGNTVYTITVLDTLTTATSPFVSNSAAVSNNTVTKLTISKTLSYDLDLDDDILAKDNCTYTVNWTSADTSIATVNQDGTVTGVSAGTTSVTATITYSDSTVVSYTILVVVRDDGVNYSSTLKTYDFYVSEMMNTTAYMGILYGEAGSNNNVKAYDLVALQEGEVVYIAFEQNAGTAVDFFAAPDDGYALTSMSATNAAGNYHALDSTDPSSTSFYMNDDAAKNQVSRYGTNVVIELIQKALNLNCDGGMGWTRGYNETASITSVLTFRSRQLPTVTKEITSIDGVAYTSGMCAEVGDVIVYTITVTQYATAEAIEYTNESLEDTINSTSSVNAVFSDTKNTTTTPSLSDSILDSAVTTKYTVTYTVQTEDLNTDLTNTVKLSYSYSSTYSSGTYTGSASATAVVEVVNFYPTGIVMDYGLPMEIDYSDHHGSYNLVSGTVDSGTIAIEDNKVTVTLDSVLAGTVTATLTDTEGTKYTFKIYPATSVYYEETFASYGTGWSVTSGGSWSGTSGTTTSTQQAHTAQDTSTDYNNYGYDGAYAYDTSGSDGTAASTTTVADSLSFTFTGTGVDIFANCDSGSGMVAIRVVDKSDGSIKKLLFVDMENTGDYSSGDGTTAYNTPIASVSGLDHGSYTVTIYLVTVNSSGFKFDGFRVYDTIENDEDVTTGDAYTVQTSVYQTDDEDYPVYYELRNNVLAGLSVNTSSSTYKDDLSDEYAQVYASSETGNGAIVVYDASSIILNSSSATVSSTDDVQSLLDNGPKNELYLYAGGTVVFTITTNREVQVGMRSVTGAEVSYSITVTESGSSVSSKTSTIKSSVDMFYDLVAKSNDTNEHTYTITIKNTGTSGVLSITDIKVSDSNDGDLFDELTVEDLVAALTGEAEEPVTYADATLTVNLTDYTGSVIATAALTENGEEGEETTFAASDILAAVEEVLPTGYALVSADDITDRTAVYGEDGSLTLQIGKVATLTVSCVKYTGLFRTTTVATFTLTKVQTSRTSRATFSASEIKAAIPANYRVLLATSASINYGSCGSKTVTVY